MTGSEGRQPSGDLTSQLASELQELMAELPIGARFAVLESEDICHSLELFVPLVLRSRYPEWENESLDGIFVARAIKTSQAEAEIIGTCILISDQTVTPFLLNLEISEKFETKSVTAVRVLLGEPGGGRLGISGPPCNSRGAQQLLMSLVDRIGEVSWSYVLGAGEGL